MRRIIKEHSGLHTAALRHFGSWSSALVAAGLTPRPQRSWTPEQVLDAIQAWHRNGRPLARFHRENRSASRAARIHFGSWRKAVAAAGIAASAKPPWTRQRLIAALQAYGRRGLVRCNHEIPRPVRMAAFNLFSTWHNALVAAGVASPDSRPQRKRWTDAELLAEIRRRSTPDSPMQIAHNPALAAVAMKRFGTWRRALRAAGAVADLVAATGD
jgi:hypothetical protein